MEIIVRGNTLFYVTAIFDLKASDKILAHKSSLDASSELSNHLD